MLEIIKEILTSPSGSFVSTSATLIVAGYVLFRAGSMTQKLKAIDRIEAAIDKIEATLESIKGEIMIIKSEIMTIKSQIFKIEEDMKQMQSSIASNRSDINQVMLSMNLSRGNYELSKKNSPMDLTNKGISVSKELNAEESIHRVWGKIKDDITNSLEKLQDRNPYTLQQECFKIGVSIKDYLDKKGMESLKTTAYERGMDTNDFAVVYGVLIRDKFFEEEKIITKKTDKNEP